MKILIAGDFVPYNRVADLLSNGKEELFSGVRSVVQGVDYSIVNLEAPIVVSKECEPIKKSGPNLKTDPRVIDAIKYMGFKAVTLANNHIRDYGDWGVSDTLFHLTQSGIDVVGAGLDNNEASAILCKSNICQGGGISIVNCCEREFSIAGEAKAGANHINPINLYYAIKQARLKSKYVIVICHGGIEHYNLPTPRMKELYRFFIDVGADAVVNHHQHCFSGYEVYNDRPIFYGLGNFCFDWKGRNSSLWTKGFMLQLEFTESIGFKLYPYIQGADNPGVTMMTEEQKIEFNEEISSLNEVIANDEKLELAYDNLLYSTDRVYKNEISPYNSRLLSALYNRGLLPSCMNKRKWYSLYNKIRCESHNERLLHMIEHYHLSK